MAVFRPPYQIRGKRYLTDYPNVFDTITPAIILSKFPFYLLLSLAFGLSPRISAMREAASQALAHQIMELSEEDVRQRLAVFDQSLMDYKMDDAVYRRIVNYIQDWPISSGRMIARSARFYPIFEEQLRAADLPLELKHLSIVESALRSWAVSPVGAAGLWQLMPGTARELGLIVNDELDERLDPTLGCAAGLDYLKIQHQRYGDWAVALAAYNSGPGNVNKAIRRSGSRNYWKMRRFLPRETQNYVPSFIAAVFLLSYHHHYGLPATLISLDDQLTDRLVVERKISLYQIARITGLRPEVVAELNPQYTRGYLPGLRGGHFLQLPRRVVPAMEEYLTLYPAGIREDAIKIPWSHPRLGEGELNADLFYERAAVAVEAGDTSIRQVAERNQLPVDRLLVWSDAGEQDSVSVGDSLYHYQVAVYQPYDTRSRETMAPSPILAVLEPSKLKTTLHHYFYGMPQPALPIEQPQAKRWWEVLR